MKLSTMLLAITLMLCNAISHAEPNDTHIYKDIGAYNAKHTQRANFFRISPKKQTGDSCVCHTMHNLRNALSKQNTAIAKEVEDGCAPNFVDNYTEFKKLYPGELFGGQNVLRSGKLVNTDEAIHRIADALDDGKVVAVGLNIKPIYDRYSTMNRVTYNKKALAYINGINHAVVVIGLQRDKTGKLLSFWIADSSGPSSKYNVSAELFRESYDSITARISRGVYIPDQPIHAKIAYIPSVP